MKSYKVTWSIDIDADSPVEAAQKTQKIQRDPDSLAGYFDVTEMVGKFALAEGLSTEVTLESDGTERVEE